ncbi:uncharacterized protein LOC131676285 [Topomyia yanbarensis]|uniref:uncharacterized protein LOC131676285 n=1 Tax=Topomyia yanbarensis TaxID=2498891 RepID=UPI00273B3930|nr:uncharacterized protein LOC131676285 [Topomyia yanbarensis]
MYLSGRCHMSFVFACLCLLLLKATVRGHAIPDVSQRSSDDSSALTLVQPPLLQSSDSETTKLSASELYNRLQPQPRRLNLDRLDSRSEPSASDMIKGRRWKLQKITPPGRGRVNNRSFNSFNEMESDEYEDEPKQQQDTALQVRRDFRVSDPDEANETDSITDLVARAARSSDVEDYFYRYVMDTDLEDALDDDDDDDDTNPEARFKKKKKFHLKHKLKKYLLPLLLAYKLKFMMMFPAMVGGLILLVKAAGLAGFFFALFASVVSLQKH